MAACPKPKPNRGCKAFTAGGRQPRIMASPRILIGSPLRNFISQQPVAEDHRNAWEKQANNRHSGGISTSAYASLKPQKSSLSR